MVSDLNFLEVQVIRRLFDKKPVDYIAMIIDKPVESVIEKMKELIDGTGRLPFADIEHNKAIRKRTSAANDSMFDDKIRRGKYKKQQQPVPQKKEDKVFQTKVVDHSKLVSVRIDKKTTIQIPRGQDPVDAKKKFLAVHKPYAVLPEAPWKKVSKFK